MSTLSPQQMAKILWDLGARGDELVFLTAVPKRESGYRTDALRTDSNKGWYSGDRGLFQINYVNDPTLKAAGIINDANDLKDPVTNARAALYMFRQSGYQPWAAGPGGWSANGDPWYGLDRASATAAVSQVSSNPNADYGAATPGATEVAPREPLEEVDVPDVQRDTTYDPTYEPPPVDPQAQGALTDLLSGFGIDYPEGPRATPQLLTFLRGLGMTQDLANDAFNTRTLSYEEQAQDAREDVARSSRRARRGISRDAESRGALSSGATNTQFANEAEDTIAKNADIERALAQSIQEADLQRQGVLDQSRQQALERTLNVETTQAQEDARSQAEVEAFQRALAMEDYEWQRQQAAEAERTNNQIRLYNSGV